MSNIQAVLRSHERSKKIFAHLMRAVESSNRGIRADPRFGHLLRAEVEELRFLLMSLDWMKKTPLWMVADASLSEVYSLIREKEPAEDIIIALKAVLEISTKLLYKEICSEIQSGHRPDWD